MQTRIASLLEVGLHFKGAPCLRSPPCLPKPPLPKNQEHPLLGRHGETELQRLGQPRWETLCDIGPTELSELSATLLGCPRSAGKATTVPQFTHLPPRGTGRDTRPGHPAAGWATPSLAPR